MSESFSTRFISNTKFDYEVFGLHSTGTGFETGIEVCDPNGEWHSEIGIWLDNQKRLVDYDGVFCLSWNAIRALRAAGITVPREYELDLQDITVQD